MSNTSTTYFPSAPELFEALDIRMTWPACRALWDEGILRETVLARHQRGDWGCVSEQQRRENACGPVRNQVRWRIVSCFKYGARSVYVITEKRRQFMCTRIVSDAEWQDYV